MKDGKLLNNYSTDEYYLSYCIEGSAQYTDENIPMDEKKNLERTFRNKRSF